MRYRKHRRASGGADASPWADPAFADALAGSDRDRGSRRSKPDYKAQQLCRQIQRALALTMSGDCGDDVLRELYVADVTSAPRSSQLLVHIVIPRHISVADAMQRLSNAMPRLRAAAARAITRRRMPELAFIPAAGWEELQP